MKIMFKRILIFFVAAAVVTLSAFGAKPVYADDESPPTEEAAIASLDQPEGGQDSLTIEPAVVGGEPAPVETPALNSIAEGDSAEQALNQLPADTAIIVLDASGEVLPLATQDAAEALVTGDPVWCPTGVLPGAPECTEKQASLSDLITVLQTKTDESNFEYSGAGTVYLAWDYDASNPVAVTADAGRNVIFDFKQLALTDLTIQGGWDFLNNETTTLPTTISGVNGLYFGDWGSGGPTRVLALNNLVIDGGALYIGSLSRTVNANVELNNVSVVNGKGANVETDRGAVSVKGGTFSNNEEASGVVAVSHDSNVTLSDVIADENDWLGARAVTWSGMIEIKNSTFNSNSWDGLYTYSADNDVLLDHVAVSENAGEGIYLVGPGNAFIKCSEFNRNGGFGVNAEYLDGSLTLNGVTFGSNRRGNYYYSGSAKINSIECTVAPPPPGETTPDHPDNLIPGDGQKQSADSQLYIILAQTQEELPSVLGQGNTFASARKVLFTQKGQLASNLTVTLAFPIPSGMQADKLAVMFWDGSKWTDVPRGYVLDGYFIVTITRPGFYVLVGR